MMSEAKKHGTGAALANHFSSAAETTRTAGDALYQAEASTQQLLKQFENTTLAQKAGRAAEEWHAGTHRADAALKHRTDLTTSTRAPSGRGAAGADVVISKNGGPLTEVQVKYHGTAKHTAARLSNEAYNGMQKVAPADQVDQIKQVAAARAQARPAKAAQYSDTARVASDRIATEGVESKPLTKAQAERLARNPRRIGAEGLKLETAQAAKGGAIAGAAIGGAIAVTRNVAAVVKGEKDAGQAVVDVVVDTAKSAGAGAAVGAGSAVARAALVRAGAEALAGSAAPVAIAATVVDAVTSTARDVRAFARGEIDGGELAMRSVTHTAKAAVRGGGAWGVAEAGAAIGTALCPGVGTFIGGLVGGLLGYSLGSALTG